MRVRDLLFARKPRKKEIPNPVQKPNGVRNDIFCINGGFDFFQAALTRVDTLRFASRIKKSKVSTAYFYPLKKDVRRVFPDNVGRTFDIRDNQWTKINLVCIR